MKGRVARPATTIVARTAIKSCREDLVPLPTLNTEISVSEDTICLVFSRTDKIRGAIPAITLSTQEFNARNAISIDVKIAIINYPIMTCKLIALGANAIFSEEKNG